MRDEPRPTSWPRQLPAWCVRFLRLGPSPSLPHRQEACEPGGQEVTKAQASVAPGERAPVESGELSLGNRIQHSIADRREASLPGWRLCPGPAKSSFFSSSPILSLKRALHAPFHARPFQLVFSRIQGLCSPPTCCRVCLVVGALGSPQPSALEGMGSCREPCPGSQRA